LQGIQFVSGQEGAVMMYDIGYWLGEVLVAVGLVGGGLGAVLALAALIRMWLSAQEIATAWRPADEKVKRTCPLNPGHTCELCQDVRFWLRIQDEGSEAEKVLAPQMLSILGYVPSPPPKPATDAQAERRKATWQASRETSTQSIGAAVPLYDRVISDAYPESVTVEGIKLDMHRVALAIQQRPFLLHDIVKVGVKGTEIKLNSGETLLIAFPSPWGDFTLYHKATGLVVKGSLRQ
jgi:hypothetical protein